MGEIVLAGVVVTLLAYLMWREVQHDRERDRLLDRIQSPSLVEYHAIRNPELNEPVAMDDEWEAEIEERRSHIGFQNGIIRE